MLTSIDSERKQELAHTINIAVHTMSVPHGTFVRDIVLDLQPWERRLLANITFNTDLYSIHHCLSTCYASMGVSNGSIIHDQVAYGWCLSNQDGTQLVTGMGPVQGIKPRS